MSKARQIGNIPNRLSVADKTELLTKTGTSVGEVIFQEDQGLLYTWNGTQWVTRNTATVSTIEEMELIVSPEDGDSVFVKDSDRGGAFVYDDTQSAVNNGGTIFDGWVRQYDGAVNFKWFGADSAGATDATSAIQAALNVGGKIIGNGIYKTTSTLTLSSDTQLDNINTVQKG